MAAMLSEVPRQVPRTGVRRHSRGRAYSAVPENPDLQRAARRLAEIEDRALGKPRKTLTAAVKAFHIQHEDNAEETKRKYKRILGCFEQFCSDRSVHHVDKVDIELIDEYRLWRNRVGWTWIKEIEPLRQFFEFCRDREWTSTNPARSLKRPTLIEANDIVPYTLHEIARIVAACDQIGRTATSVGAHAR